MYAAAWSGKESSACTNEPRAYGVSLGLRALKPATSSCLYLRLLPERVAPMGAQRKLKDVVKQIWKPLPEIIDSASLMIWRPPATCKLKFWTHRGHENKVTRQVIRSLTKSVASIHKELCLGCIIWGSLQRELQHLQLWQAS